MMTNKIMSPEYVKETARSQLKIVQEILEDSKAVDSNEKFSALITSTLVFTGIGRKILSKRIETKLNTILDCYNDEDFPGLERQGVIICEVQKILKEKIKELEGKLRPDTQE